MPQCRLTSATVTAEAMLSSTIFINPAASSREETGPKLDLLPTDVDAVLTTKSWAELIQNAAETFPLHVFAWCRSSGQIRLLFGFMKQVAMR